MDADQKTKDQFSDLQNPEKSVYFTDEVKIRIENDEQYVNEFKILNNIGKGSFSKVKKVLREWHDADDTAKAPKEKLFAMKVSASRHPLTPKCR